MCCDCVKKFGVGGKLYTRQARYTHEVKHAGCVVNQECRALNKIRCVCCDCRAKFGVLGKQLHPERVARHEHFHRDCVISRVCCAYAGNEAPSQPQDTLMAIDLEEQKNEEHKHEPEQEQEQEQYTSIILSKP